MQMFLVLGKNRWQKTGKRPDMFPRDKERLTLFVLAGDGPFLFVPILDKCPLFVLVLPF